MAELTKQQVDRATEKAIVEFGVGPVAPWRVAVGLRAAAPFLQLPWDEPTPEELSAIHKDWFGALEFVTEFVLRRNAFLLPKPVDPRKAAIVSGIKSYGYIGDQGALADRILAALDEVK